MKETDFLSEAVEEFEKRSALSAAGIKHRLRRLEVDFFEIQPGEFRTKWTQGKKKPVFVKGLSAVPDPEVLQKIEASMSGQAAWAASLAAGELPAQAPFVFFRCGSVLLSTAPDSLKLQCSSESCEGQSLCGHAALSGFMFLEELKKHPLNILTFRGLPAAELLERLRAVQTRKRPGGFPLAEPESSGSEQGFCGSGRDETFRWARAAARDDEAWFEKIPPTGWLWKGRDVQEVLKESLQRVRQAAAKRLSGWEERRGVS